MKQVFSHSYNDIISIENLLCAWQNFLSGKKSKIDVQEFQLHLMDNILSLFENLKNITYKHSGYHSFNICDPKPRNIHKAIVRDRLLHHLIYQSLYPFFDKTFISDSYSCRDNKGTYKALKKFKIYSNKVSKNNTKTTWILKCDIRKFFATIDHATLMKIIECNIKDRNILNLLHEVVSSFSVEKEKGLPLGNLTSQLFANMYMNEFDQFVKHKLKVKYYIRYADDFVFLSNNKEYLKSILSEVSSFLEIRLLLKLHPNKISLESLSSGIDFLGWVHFSNHKVLRTTTKKRMFKKLKVSKENKNVLQSYLGLLSHGNTKKLQKSIEIIA